MNAQQYKVIMTGELLAGFSEAEASQRLAEIFQASADSMRLIFTGGQHPINEQFSADEALSMQARLEGAGVCCKIEKLPSQTIDVRIRRTPATAQSPPTPAPQQAAIAHAGLMRCPSCGQEQIVASSCVSCRVVFSDYNAQTAASGSAVQSTAPIQSPTPAPIARETVASDEPMKHPQDNWSDAWDEFVDVEEPGEHYHLALFFGEKGEQYMQVCEPYMKGPRTQFALGWNWAVVASPFLWMMYRKMWGWAILAFITGIFIPSILMVVGRDDFSSSNYVLLGGAFLLANRLIWPAVANYLYCRYARMSVRQLHVMASNYAAEIDIATAGGVSGASMLVGLALAAVINILLWSVVGSVEDKQRFVQEQRLFKQGGEVELTDYEGKVVPSGHVDGIGDISKAPKNKWIDTRTKLRALGTKLNDYMSLNNADDIANKLNLFQLRQELSIEAVELLDGWGGEVQYIPDTEGYRLISAGPDRLFGTADDIQYRRVLNK